MEKIYRSQAEKIVKGILLIFEEKQNAEKVIAEILQSDKRMGSKDRKKVAHSLFEITRWMLLYNGGILFPIHPWRILKNYILNHHYLLPEWEEFQNDVYTSIDKEYVNHSIPEWLYEFGIEQCGNQWPLLLNELNKQALPCLRRNTLFFNDSEMQNFLNENKIEFKKLSETAYQISAHQHPEKTKAFEKGMFEFQDFHSQKIGEFCDAKPGQLVIDCCAGAGGKSLHLAEIMKDKGQVISFDIAKQKLKVLNNRAKRLRLHCIKTIEEPNQLNNFINKADCVLIDAPCSGTGVLKRNPDFKWKLSKEKMDELILTQENILSEYSSLCKKGGNLIYATCSVFPSENQNQVKKFLQKNKDRFQLIEERSLLPNEFGDGFYMAKFQKL